MNLMNFILLLFVTLNSAAAVVLLRNIWPE